MDKKVKARLSWINLYKETKNAGLVCRRCSISRPTLRKLLKRYDEKWVEGLLDRGRRTLNSPKKIIKNKDVFPTDGSIKKIIFLSIKNAAKSGLCRLEIGL